MTKQERVLFILVAAFFITLYIRPINSINIALVGILFIYTLSITSFKEKIEVLKERKYVVGMVLFFALLLVSTLLSDNLEQGLQFLKVRIPLLLFPISIGLLRLRKGFRDKMLMSFALVTVAVCFFCLGESLIRYAETHRTDAIYNDNLTSLIEQQSVYIALLVNFAIYIFGYFILYRKTRFPFLVTLAILFLIFISYLLGSRINMGLLALTTVCFGFYFLISKKKYLELVTLCLGLLLAGFVVYKIQPKMLNRYKELTYNKFEYANEGQESHYNMELTEDQWNGTNFRLAAWNCGWELFREHPWTGVGLGDKQDQLYAKYAQKDFRFAIETRKNVHNNYLDTLYSMGLLGFLAFVSAWFVLPLWHAFKFNDGLSVLIIFTLACALVTEIYLDRSLGGIVTGFFVPFMLAGVYIKRTT